LLRFGKQVHVSAAVNPGAEVFPNLVGKSSIDRVRVGHVWLTQLGQKSEDCLALDTEPASHIVNGNPD
jgi:hypothetical protein